LQEKLDKTRFERDQNAKSIEELEWDLKETREKLLEKMGDQERTKNLYKEDIARREREYSQKINEYNCKLKLAVEEERKTNSKFQNAIREFEITIATSKETEENLRQQFSDKINQLQCQMNEQYGQCKSLEAEVERVQQQSMSEKKKLEHEATILRLELERMNSEKEVCLKRISFTEENLKECHDAIHSMQAQLTAEHEEKLEQQIQSAHEQACNQSSGNTESLKRELDSARDKITRLSQSLVSQARNHEKELQKVTKRASAYKTKALEAHEKSRQAKQILRQHSHNM